MAHARKQIRDAVIATLTGLTTTGNNVFASRVYPIQASELPCLVIHSGGETVNLTTQDGTMERNLTLDIEIRVKATTALEDMLDTISSEIETALLGTLPAGVKVSELSAVQFGLSGDGDQPHGFANMQMNFVYYTKESVPEVII